MISFQTVNLIKNPKRKPFSKGCKARYLDDPSYHYGIIAGRMSDRKGRAYLDARWSYWPLLGAVQSACWLCPGTHHPVRTKGKYPVAEKIKLKNVVVKDGMIVILRSSGGPIKYSPSQAEVFLKLWRKDPEYYFLTPEFLDKFERAINRHKSLADLKL